MTFLDMIAVASQMQRFVLSFIWKSVGILVALSSRFRIPHDRITTYSHIIRQILFNKKRLNNFMLGILYCSQHLNVPALRMTIKYKPSSYYNLFRFNFPIILLYFLQR